MTRENMEIKTITEKVISGFVTRTNNSAEMTPEQGKIPGLWQKFDQTIPVDYQNGERVFGVYFNYESDHTGEFDVLAGFNGASAHKNITKITIPAGKYLVFTHQGEMPQIAIDAWTEVWQYFTNGKNDVERTFLTDFEYYPNANQIEVHIGIN